MATQVSLAVQLERADRLMYNVIYAQVHSPMSAVLVEYSRKWYQLWGSRLTASTQSRSCWLLSPWMDSAGQPSCRSCRVSESQPRFVSQKICAS